MKVGSEFWFSNPAIIHDFEDRIGADFRLAQSVTIVNIFHHFLPAHLTVGLDALTVSLP